MKKLIALVAVMVASTSAWAATVSGTVESVEVAYAPSVVVMRFRYYVKLEGNPTVFFVEVDDGKLQAHANAQFTMLMSALTLGHTVTFETDYEGPFDTRIRDLKIHK